MVSSAPHGPARKVLVLDRNTGEVKSLPEHSESVSSRSLLSIPERGLLISQFHHSPQYPDPIGDTTTPEVVDPETGARAPILTTDDWVVATVPAASLEP